MEKVPALLSFSCLKTANKKVGINTFPDMGMLVTHVYYSSSAWSSNVVNNTSTAMGVDIVEADGLASDNDLSGDPFPGTSGVTSYTPHNAFGNHTE